MKKLFLFLLISVCFAATPEETVNKMYQDLKSSRSLSTLVDYVNWDSEFQALKPEDKKSIGVNSSSELSAFVKKFLKSPGAVFLEKVKGTLEQVPPAQAAEIMKELTKKGAELDTAIKKFEGEISKWEVSVLNSKITGDKAIVNVKESFNGQTAERPIEMVQVNGKWYLTKGGVEHFGQNMGNRQPAPNQPAAGGTKKSGEFEF